MTYPKRSAAAEDVEYASVLRERVRIAPSTPTAAALRRMFDAVEPFTVGLEEEVMLLDPRSLDLTPRAGELLRRLGGDPRFKLELPACEVEISTTPAASVSDAIAQLAAARSDLSAAAAGIALLAGTGTHPFAAPEGALQAGPRYAMIEREYGSVARRQLVASLQVHVAVGGAARTLAVYNRLRLLLPELAALAANAPFHAGEDTGLASTRALICGALPRQGIPPALKSWEQLAGELRWGAVAGSLREHGLWWWELRPHPSFGTLEVRVPDAQSTLADAAAVAATIQALVVWLAEHPESIPQVADWRIAENRFSAMRHGLDGTLADLRSGEPTPTRQRLDGLLRVVRETAKRLGGAPMLEHAEALAIRNGAMRQREIAAERGLRGLVEWQAERFCDPLPQASAPLSGNQGRVSEQS